MCLELASAASFKLGIHRSETGWNLNLLIFMENSSASGSKVCTVYSQFHLPLQFPVPWKPSKAVPAGLGSCSRREEVGKLHCAAG